MKRAVALLTAAVFLSLPLSAVADEDDPTIWDDVKARPVAFLFTLPAFIATSPLMGVGWLVAKIKGDD